MQRTTAYVKNQVSSVESGTVRVEFVRVIFHPLVAAIAVIKGKPGEAMTIVDTKTVVFFDPKRASGRCMENTSTTEIGGESARKKNFVISFACLCFLLC
jgi:hypothetical protein